MGQALPKSAVGVLPSILPTLEQGDQELLEETEREGGDTQTEISKFPDLSSLPPELAIQVLANLNATDLCLAACVWQQLASDSILWLGLCRQQWQHCRLYSRTTSPHHFRQLYLTLDEGTLTFNSCPEEGMEYFFQRGILQREEPGEIARFFHGTKALAKKQVRQYLQGRQELVECLVSLQNFSNTFLPNALRKFFSKLEAPSTRGDYLQRLLYSFASRFCQCNPSLGFSVDSVYVMCFSLILLSVDLSSPHVKNKMSKREFIKNTAGAVRGEAAGDPTDLYGQLYDNIFLRGHVAQEGGSCGSNKQNFVPGYLAMFL